MKLYKVLLVIVIVLGIAVCPANASAATDSGIINISNTSNRSYDSSFSLDFSEYKVWNLDFDNNAFAIWNHTHVTVDYTSCKPYNTNAKVKIELYIDDDKDGTYELYDPKGGYTYQLKVGDYIKIELPHGNTVKNYRLQFTNQLSSTTSGDFTVTTSRD